MARLAKSLVTLRDQVDSAFPHRSKASDGWLADQDHAARASDHNPNSAGVVCALDLTHDPSHGFDAHTQADHLRTHRHPNLKYIISNRRIASKDTGWKWATYTGINPHTKHVHFSVGVGPDGRSRQPYDDTTKWQIITSNSNPIPGVTVRKILETNSVEGSIVIGNDGSGWFDADAGLGTSIIGVSAFLVGRYPGDGYTKAGNVAPLLSTKGSHIQAQFHGVNPGTYGIIVTVGKI